MKSVFNELIELLLTERKNFNQVYFANDQLNPPAFSYQVNFPRLELVLSGEYSNLIETEQRSIGEIKLRPGDALYIPPNCWNKPDWNANCSILSLLFGRRQLGLSLVSKKQGEANFYDVQKHSIPIRTGHSIDHILEALNALSTEWPQKPMDGFLLQALLSYSHSMLSLPINETKKRSEALYQSICIYIQENFHLPIGRSNISTHFNISSSHLSRLFRQQGHMTLANYITWVRIERAKFMLKKYPFRLSDVATRCGYQDINYFCRVFKNNTGRTPSEYRGLVQIINI